MDEHFEKAFPFAIFPKILIPKIFLKAGHPPKHQKFVDINNKIVAFRSNTTGDWYVLREYRWSLSRRRLLDLALEQSSVLCDPRILEPR